MNQKETIAAIATPPGEGGIAIIRISGENALTIADQVFSGSVQKYPSHTCHFGKIYDGSEVIDQALLIVMHAPRSYTGEDTVEIQCHGGSIVSKKVLDVVLNAGAKPAGPGAFTHQAFMNGKLDLAQAEAVQAFIGAKNELALKAAKNQLEGKLSLLIREFQQKLLDTAAILEAWVDFPEEGLEFATKDEVLLSLKEILKKMLYFEQTFEEGKKIFEGLTVCLIGSPNAGKSSLMNALLGQEKAIVTHIPGTTRDLLEAQMHLAGLHLQITDTAGIRKTNELIEQEGIRRSKQAIETSDLLLLIIDASQDLTEEDQQLLATTPKEKTLLVWNKTDLPHAIPKITWPYQVAISAKTKTHFDELKKTILRMIWKEKKFDQEEVVLTQKRHKQALTSAIKDLKNLIVGLKTDVSPEFLSSDMRSCLNHLSSIIGIDISEDLLSAIFAKFCVGK